MNRLSSMRRAGDLYEMAVPPADPALSNKDLAPTGISQRTWGTYHIASLWIGGHSRHSAG